MPKIGHDKDYTQKTIAFFKWLKGFMASADVTQTELAGQLGITPQAVNKHFKHNVPFDYPQLVGIFTYLNVPDEEIAKQLKQRR